MNKELTPLQPLENLKELEMWATNGYTACEVEKAKELVKPIETALKQGEMEHTLRVRLENANYELVRKQEEYKKLRKEWESGHSVDFSKVRFEVQNLLPDPNAIGKKLKAFEIVKKHKLLNYVLKNPKCASMYHLSEEEIELLKEILK